MASIFIHLIPLLVTLAATPANSLIRGIKAMKNIVNEPTIEDQDHRATSLFLYEVFMKGRKEGMMALEPLLIDGPTNDIRERHEVLERHPYIEQWIRYSLTPVVNGTIKPDQLKDRLAVCHKADQQFFESATSILVRFQTTTIFFIAILSTLWFFTTHGSHSLSTISTMVRTATNFLDQALVQTAILTTIYILKERFQQRVQRRSRLQSITSKQIIAFSNGQAPAAAITLNTIAPTNWLTNHQEFEKSIQKIEPPGSTQN